jgi:uncharacterized membrane protein YphA (DoxX/SURF4 family)
MTTKRFSVEHFIFEEYKTIASSLGIYRILFAANILLYLPQQLWVPNFPDSFFNPPVGLTLFFTGFPGALFFWMANSLAIVAAVCLLFGYRTRLASISFSLLLLLCDYWAYSFGKINHDIPLILIPLILQAAGWGSGYSMDAKRLSEDGGTERETTAWPLALVALVMGIAMMSAAVPKAASGWLDPHTHAVRAHMLYNVLVTGRSNWFAEHMLRINSGVFWEFFDYATVLIEAAFLVTVFSRRAFLMVSALACFFHLGIALTMEIAFTGNILVYAAVIDWSALESRAGGLLHAWNRILDSLSTPWVLGCAVTVAFVYLRFGNPLQLPQEWDPVGVLICAFSAIVATMFLFGLVRNWVRNWVRKPVRSVALSDSV